MTMEELLEKDLSKEQLNRIIDSYRPMVHEWIFDAYIYPIVYILSLISLAKLIMKF